jgi:hypothetical protein
MACEGSSADGFGRATDEPTQAFLQVEATRARLALLQTRVAAVREMQAALEIERTNLDATIDSVEHLLETQVAAPLKNGCDPTEWLPDELIIEILLRVPTEALWRGTCHLVCRRWMALAETRLIKSRLTQSRWEAHALGWIRPQDLDLSSVVTSLAVGTDATVFCGCQDGCILVVKKSAKWNAETATETLTLTGHTQCVRSLAIGPDGTLYSASGDRSVRAWAGSGSFECIRSLEGHTRNVSAVVVGSDGTVYSGSWDSTARIWAGDDGTHLCTLTGHDDVVVAIALGSNGNLHTASDDCTIRVWSTATHRLLEVISTVSEPIAVVCSPHSSHVYAALCDGTINVWSADARKGFVHGPPRSFDITCITPLAFDCKNLIVPVFGRRFEVWREPGDFSSDASPWIIEALAEIMAMTVGPDGRLYSGGAGYVRVW